MNKSQNRTIEWLKEKATNQFDEFQMSKQKTLEFSINDEQSEGELVFLSIKIRAKEGTGMLFVLDKSIMIAIGKKGGIVNVHGTSFSKTRAIYLVRQGIIP